ERAGDKDSSQHGRLHAQTDRGQDALAQQKRTRATPSARGGVSPCSFLIVPWDGLQSPPPHLGPLPRGEGEWSAISRSQPCLSLPTDHRLGDNQRLAVPSS